VPFETNNSVILSNSESLSVSKILFTESIGITALSFADFPAHNSVLDNFVISKTPSSFFSVFIVPRTIGANVFNKDPAFSVETPVFPAITFSTAVFKYFGSIF